MFFFTPSEVAKGRNYPGMILSHFSHADGMHLLFNMMTLYFFGPYVESGLGPAIMILIYVAAAVLATLVVYFRHRAEPGYSAHGASDSICGILFAAIVLVPESSIYFFLIPIPIPAPIAAILYIVVSTFLMRSGRGNISHEAHLAGAFCGLILAGLLSPYGFRPLLFELKSFVD